MKRYNIAVVVPKYGLVGGGERFVLELTERIACNPKYEVHVLANQWRAVSDKITFHKIPIIRFPKFLTPLSFAYFVNRKLSEINADLVHSHERTFDADIVTLHSVPHRFWIKNIRKKIFMSLSDLATDYVERKMSTGRCRYFLPVSELTKQKFSEQYPLDISKIRIIHPGVDIQTFKPISQEFRQSIRRQIGIAASDVVIIFVSMNFELKGLDALMKAISLTDAPDLKLLVVGKGNIRKYEACAKNLGIASKMIFTGVWADGIENLYGAADLFAMLSRFDTFGMAVSEAMACGLPVIVSPFVGAKDWVSHGENGWIVNPEDIETIASFLSLMADASLRQMMGESAYRTAVHHTWDAMAAQVTEIYEALLKTFTN